MSTQLNQIEIEERIVAALKRRKGTATAGDIATDTGLPLGDVEVELKRIMSLYKSHLDVDDNGNLRYRFDPSLVRRGETVERALYKARKAIWNGFKWFFKAWIMIMLVGYTITFVVVLVALAVAAMASGSRSDSDSSDGIARLPIYLLGRFLEYMFWFSLFDNNRGYGRRNTYGRSRSRKKIEKPEKPFYQKVFDFVFGPEATSDPLNAHQSFASYVRYNKGRITAADWASRTGQTLEQAENALTAGIMRFGGEVDVTPAGNLLYRFDELRVSARDSGNSGRNIEPIWHKKASAPPLTGNPGGTNAWIGAFNLFNLVMSIFVLSGAGAATALPMGAVIGLGWVPLVFSVLFFAVPLMRWIGNMNASSRAEKENARRQAYKAVYSAALENKPVRLDPAIAKPVALALEGEPDLEGGGDVWIFETLASQLADGQNARQVTADRVVFGHTVFSSDEAEKSLEESELEEFDRRFAFELGAPVEEKATASASVHVLN